ncbi:hypothetical protein [Burkholderia plantarii]|uniref:hypothetical protein n=1 Tax=Burkholderia plantarii TaxID=41899 RepID=UPI00114C89BC|nr:hypothetical protein [Burkholderia plantarii]
MPCEFTPVSYTHLDVYKRQVTSMSDASAKAGGDLDVNGTLQAARSLSAIASGTLAEAGACLLYTSRCV